MTTAGDPAVRALLLERAAGMVRRREPVTVRSLVAGTGVSTTALYTRFGGIDGLWQALRQEGFTRLACRFAATPVPKDPVEHLAALIAQYVATARADPDLYRVMFDASVDLEDFGAADATLEHLVQAAARARDVGRLGPGAAPLEVSTRSWALTHGVVSLVFGGPLPLTFLDHVLVLLRALLVAEGDDPDRAQRSIAAGWKTVPRRSAQPSQREVHRTGPPTRKPGPTCHPITQRS